MKYIFSFLLMMALSNMNAQNLQFSQVLTFTGRIENYSIYQASTIWTVPEGKVWKVELYSLDFLHINDNLISNRNNEVGNSVNQGVLWLKAGDTVQYKSPYTLTDYKYILSIIEFTIVS